MRGMVRRDTQGSGIWKEFFKMESLGALVTGMLRMLL